MGAVRSDAFNRNALDDSDFSPFDFPGLARLEVLESNEDGSPVPLGIFLVQIQYPVAAMVFAEGLDLKRLGQTRNALPTAAVADELSNRDHDRILYGK